MNTRISRFRLRSVAAVIASTLAATAAWAVEPFTVRDIRVEGLQRVEPGTIFASLPLRVGDTYSDETGSAAIRALFELGLFKDVRLDVNNGVLVVIVEERPTVADVDFVGTKEFDKTALQKSLREVGLADGRPYDKALTDRAEQELKRQYVSKSLYNAQVVTTVTPIERNRVNLTFTVTEGEPARIREVHIVGAKAFSESTLLNLFDQDAGGWMSWYTKSNQYSRVKLNADLETLRSYYLSRGYLEFRIDSTQVALSPDREDLAVTVNITEGEKFTVAGVKLDGNYLGRDDEFKSLVTIRAGQPYNGEQVAETTKAFTDRLSVGGNNKTRDEVVRREFRQYEASWYDGDKIKLSRDRVDRLGFFTEVSVDTQEVPGSPDQVDLTVNVVEKPTGSLQLGAGFSSSEKVSLTFGISQENVFGSGNFLGLQVNTSKYYKTISLTATDPYFTKDGISRTFSLFHQTSRPYYTQDGDYSLVSEGGSIKFGVPFSEVDTVFFGAGLERFTFKPGTIVATATPQAYRDYFGCQLNAAGVINSCTDDSKWGLPLTIGWARDDRDSALVPTSGRLQRGNLEWGVGGDLKYVKSSYQYQQYFPLTKQYTLAFNGEVGYGKALQDQAYPIFKNFYAGGLGSIRGFEQNSLGPRDTVTRAALGGTKKAIFNAELSTPFPGAGNDRTLRLYGFFDVGNVFTDRTSQTDAQWAAQKKIRASLGLGISWISPLGPLRLAFARPIRSQKEDDLSDPANPIYKDRIQSFQFQIGTSF
ncbi:MAG: outer membrane protein assembly factor BamA [Variovorax sp.]|nr:MAG: outer membrane protein assembly factor BamA [Variovorax sp.]